MTEKTLTTYQRWDGIAKTIMKGKKIVDVGYIDKSEAEHYAWHNRGVWFQLDDGTRLICMRDDEGNDAGVLAYIHKEVDAVLPVIGMDD
jgi:hypothetical protein|tara:strand:+ start:448 stop:714 length:267 start_codon:yes stop_codon:yes gene_type:complete